MSLEKIIPNKDKALFLAKRELAVFVWDAVNLEGIHYTLPEVQTLLDGVTVGGHRLTDQIITLNQFHAWQFLFKAIEHNQFELSKDFACKLHDIAAKEEALKWGVFRNSSVSIAGTAYHPPPANTLDQHWEDMVETAKAIEHPFDQAIYVFLTMSRVQFFFDVNKRMGRFMMNGLLLSKGLPAINLPAKAKLTFNQLMLDFYTANDPLPMTAFMKRCLDAQTIKIMCEN